MSPETRKERTKDNYETIKTLEKKLKSANQEKDKEKRATIKITNILQTTQCEVEDLQTKLEEEREEKLKYKNELHQAMKEISIERNRIQILEAQLKQRSDVVANTEDNAQTDSPSNSSADRSITEEKIVYTVESDDNTHEDIRVIRSKPNKEKPTTNAKQNRETKNTTPKTPNTTPPITILMDSNRKKIAPSLKLLNPDVQFNINQEIYTTTDLLLYLQENKGKTKEEEITVIIWKGQMM